MYYYWLFVFLIFGLIIGSFLNVCIYRIPHKLTTVKGRSFCPGCRTTLYPRDMIPIFSYILLRGRCRFCKTPISLRYPVIETLTGVSFVLAYIHFGLSVQAVLLCLFYCCLIVVSGIDFDTMEIPDRLALFILGLSLLKLLCEPQLWKSALAGCFIVSLPMLMLAVFTNGFGGGDIKLCASAGCFLGFRDVLLGSFFGCILGAVFGILLLLLKKGGRKTLFAFGPFLCAGFFLASLYGERFLAFYISAAGF